MNMFIHCLSLDIREPMTQAYINVKKGDTARKLIFTFSNYGSAYHISDGCTAVFRAKKPDGTILFNSCTINGNAVEYIFTSQTVAAVGIVECEVTLADADGKQITSPRFALIVENVLYSDDEVESTNEFTKLQEALAEANNLGITIEKNGDEIIITITNKDGTKSVTTIYAGSKGAPGKDGDTPVRGTDYWTEADKTEIVDETKAAIDLSSYAKTEDIPTKTSQLDNDSGFLDSEDVIEAQFVDIPTKLSELDDDVGYLTLDTLPKYDGSVSV